MPLSVGSFGRIKIFRNRISREQKGGVFQSERKMPSTGTCVEGKPNVGAGTGPKS